MKQKNLIMIVADQLRADVLGKGFTPHLDALAAESVRFERAYCGSPLCVPARGVLFTGLCPNTNGSRINPWLAEDAAAGDVHAGVQNLYTMMEQAGYDCIHTGKQHLFTEGGKLEDAPDTRTRWLTTEKTYRDFLQKNGKRAPGGARFRTPVPEMAGGHTTRLVNYSNAETGCYEEGEAFYFDGYFTEEGLAGLRTRDTAKPLFLSAMFLAPHPPLDIPEPYYSAVANEAFTLPENVGRWYPYQSPLQMYNLTGVVGSRYTLAQWRETWRVYLGLVQLLDDCVGRLLAELRAQGIYDDSVIVFTADHGEMLGSHRLFQKMCMYEESARVPLFVRAPGKVPCSVAHPVSHVDVLPTLCELLHLPQPEALEGRSLFAPASERDVFIQFDGNGALGNFQRCIVRGPYKLIADLFKDEVFFELYDTVADPQETTNLLFAEGGEALAAPLLDALRAHMHATNDTQTLDGASLAAFLRQYAPFPAKQGALT